MKPSDSDSERPPSEGFCSAQLRYACKELHFVRIDCARERVWYNR
jgi:hypothetical protein